MTSMSAHSQLWYVLSFFGRGWAYSDALSRNEALGR